MLDASIVAFAKNNRPEAVLERMRGFDPGDLCVSAVTLAELEHGVFNSSNPERNQLALTLFLANVDVVPFGGGAAVEYGRMRADLRRKGTPIGANDPLMAAHAKPLGTALAASNTRGFSRVEGLAVEDWAT